MRWMIASIVALTTLCQADTVLKFDAQPRDGKTLLGVYVDLAAVCNAKRPTQKVYVEEAVAIWRPSYGEMIVAAVTPEASDINAAVKTMETEKPLSFGAAIGQHLVRNAGKYIAGLGVLAAGAAGYIIYENNKDDGIPTAPTVPTEFKPQTSPSISVIAGDNSPVSIDVDITAMPPE